MSNPTSPLPMIGEAPIFLDVNIPMYAVGGEHAYKVPCMWLMERIALGAFDVVVNVEILQEILHRYMALGRLQTGVDMCEQVADLSELVYAVDATDMQSALAIARTNAPSIRARDCVHIATMRRYGLSSILSTDRHFDSVPGITRLDPLALYREAGSPDIAALFG